MVRFCINFIQIALNDFSPNFFEDSCSRNSFEDLLHIFFMNTYWNSFKDSIVKDFYKYFSRNVNFMEYWKHSIDSSKPWSKIIWSFGCHSQCVQLYMLYRAYKILSIPSRMVCITNHPVRHGYCALRRTLPNLAPGRGTLMSPWECPTWASRRTQLGIVDCFISWLPNRYSFTYLVALYGGAETKSMSDVVPSDYSGHTTPRANQGSQFQCYETRNQIDHRMPNYRQDMSP